METKVDENISGRLTELEVGSLPQLPPRWRWRLSRSAFGLVSIRIQKRGRFHWSTKTSSDAYEGGVADILECARACLRKVSTSDYSIAKVSEREEKRAESLTVTAVVTVNVAENGLGNVLNVLATPMNLSRGRSHPKVVDVAGAFRVIYEMKFRDGDVLDRFLHGLRRQEGVVSVSVLTP